MPLLRKTTVHPHVILGIWEMTEHPSEFPQWYEEACRRFRAEGRQREYVCVRALLQQITDDPSLTICHYESGKPYLKNGWHISISHTKGFCCVIVSPDHEVAVDIEYISDRVSRIAHKFMRQDESATTITGQLIHWSVKETLYKLYSEDQLGLEEMRLLPFELQERGMVLAENMKRNEIVDVSYEISSFFVLTYAFK
jgi:4'-phosphopantetheinyl transferase EntD